MDTFRDLVIMGFETSGLTGMGVTLQTDQMKRGVRTVNMILTELYTKSTNSITSSKSVTFTGSMDMTIGLDAGSDIVVAQPERIKRIVYSNAGDVNTCYPVNADAFFTSDKEIRTNYPSAFYYERTNPQGTIHFINGAPSGDGTIVFAVPLLDIDANTRLEDVPTMLIPYLHYELAARLCIPHFDPLALKLIANANLRAYELSTYQGGNTLKDKSATSRGRRGSYDWRTGEVS